MSSDFVVCISVLMVLNVLCYRYKWTIPVKWHSVQSDKNMVTMFDKDSAGIVSKLSF